MTEAEWHACTSPEAMLHHLTDRASPRKLRLYAVNCCRRIWHLLIDPRCQHAIDVAQRFVDGKAAVNDLSAAERNVAAVARVWGDTLSPVARATYAIGGAAWAATRGSAWLSAWDAAWDARMVARDFIPGTDWEKERRWQAGVLHDLIGNPFRPSVIDPAWLSDSSPVTQMARVIYTEDRFGDLPILGNALEEASCTDVRLLEHCRAKGEHWRGCWVVDAILGYR
jgi:hypothetical protein